MVDELKKEGDDGGKQKAEPFKLNEMYAFVSVNEEGNEGILGMPSPHGVLPMFTADKKNLPKLMEGAQLFANSMDRKITVLKFSGREEVETIEPSMLIKPDMGVQRVQTSMSGHSDDVLKKQ